MKKTSLFVMVFILIIFQQCYDSGLVKPGATTAQVLQEVKDWYEKGLTATEGSSLTSKIGFTSTALWEKSKTYAGKTGDKHIVVTPLLSYSRKQPQSRFQLIAFRNKEKIQGFILQLIPDRDYLIKKYQTKENLAFSGQIKVKSKSGKQMKTFLFKDGKRKPFVKGVSSTFRTMDEGEEGGDGGEGDDGGDGGDGGEGDDGTTTVEFDPNEVEPIGYSDGSDDSTMLDEVVITASRIYDFSDYTYLWLDGGMYHGGDIAGCVSADVNGDGVADIGVPIKNDEYIISPTSTGLCGTINFTNVGSSYTAQIDGLGLSAVNSGGQILNVELGSNCVSIPNYNISPGQASDLFKDAYAYAANEIGNSLNSGTLSPTSAAVRPALINLMRSYLSSVTPGSSFSAGPCSGNVAQNQAQYKGIDC